MKCPDFLLKAFANGEGVDCWCWNESKKDGKRANIIRFDVEIPNGYDNRSFGSSDDDWFKHAEPFIENYKKLHEFKPLDPVLVRDYNTSLWRLQFFDRYGESSNEYIVVGDASYYQCILYETHKDLKDTSNEPTDIN